MTGFSTTNKQVGSVSKPLMKIFIGTVVSTKMAKTATVKVERVVLHPVYKKRVKTEKKYQLHDEIGAEVGQRVKFAASKPYSKTKKWKLLEIINEKTNTKDKQKEKSNPKTASRKK